MCGNMKKKQERSLMASLFLEKLKSKEKAVIVCLGDSITCNRDEKTYTDFWQDQLREEFRSSNVEVVNAGVNGETAQDGYYRLEKDVIIYRPDLVTVMFGHNEVMTGVSPREYQRYLSLICDKLENETEAEIWLLTPNKVADSNEDKKYQPYLKEIKTLARQRNAALVDVYRAFEDQGLDEIYTSTFDYWGLVGRDWVHPNEKGQRLIAQFLMQHL